MGKHNIYILTLLLICCQPYIMAESVYPTTIDSHNPSILNIADLSSCFDSTGKPAFDELYIFGRIWQESQIINYYQLPDVNLDQLKDKDNIHDFSISNVRQDSRQNNLLWYVEPVTMCSVIIRQTLHRVHYMPVTDQFGNITCEVQTLDSILTDSTKYLYLHYTDTLPPDTSVVVTQSDTCSCRWTTAQGFTIKEYRDYEYLTTSYNWSGLPDTVIDTVGCIVMRINRQVFNTHYEGTDMKPMGELKYVNGATEWISPTDTAFIAGAPGGGYNIAKMFWIADTIQDTYYWPTSTPLDTIYTLFRYSAHNANYHFGNMSDDRLLNYQFYNQQQSNAFYSNVPSFRAALYEYNTLNKTQQTFLHADVLHYAHVDNNYQYVSRHDAREHGIQKITAANKKLYFTGKLVPATIYSTTLQGKTQKSNFTGAVSGNNDGPAVIFIHNRGKNDIYLENFQLGTTSLTIEDNEPTSMFNKEPRRYISTAITLQGNGQDTYIHFRGTNYLCGSSGKSTISTLYGAAVYMNVNSTDYISLTFDDIWTDGSHTRGLLKMEGSVDPEIGNTASTYHCSASPIYSGNNRTAVTFNGGTYHFAPADNTTSTVNFMIVSRRNYKTPLVNYTFPDVGSDVGDGLVYIRDGNFRMTTPLLSNPRNIPMMLPDGKEYNKEYYIMYMPLRTYITGGNFENCLVRTTDGDASAPNCTGLINCPTNGTDTVFAYYIPCDTADNRTIADTKAEPDAIAYDYDFTNLHPLTDTLNNEQYVIPYLPSRGMLHCDNISDGNTQNWDVLFSQGISADLPAVDRPLYVTQKREKGELLNGTNYFGIFEINPDYPTEHHIVKTNLLEQGDYTINRRVYFITWTMSDKWRIKTMPLDVSEVNLIYTWATDNVGHTTDPDLEWDYYKKIMQTIAIKGRLTELDTELGMNMPFWSLYRRAVASKGPVISQSTSSDTYFPQVARAKQQIYYFGQSDTIKPSFYLLEANDEPMPNGKFCRSWTIPQPDENGIIMHRGRTYAFMFPDRELTDTLSEHFWNGKYIVLEGPGQTMSNSPTAEPAIESDQIVISGNSSLKQANNLPYQRYDWSFSKQCFERSPYTAVDWTEPYILAGNDTWAYTGLFDIQCINDTTTDALPAMPADDLICLQNGLEVQLISPSDTQISIFVPNGQLVKHLYLKANQTYSTTLPQGIYIMLSTRDNKFRKIIIQ